MKLVLPNDKDLQDFGGNDRIGNLNPQVVKAICHGISPSIIQIPIKCHFITLNGTGNVQDLAKGRRKDA